MGSVYCYDQISAFETLVLMLSMDEHPETRSSTVLKSAKHFDPLKTSIFPEHAHNLTQHAFKYQREHARATAVL